MNWGLLIWWLSGIALGGGLGLLLAKRKQSVWGEQVRVLAERLDQMEHYSGHFPEFLTRGEDMSRSLTQMLELRLTQLKTLLTEADTMARRLELAEQTLRESRLNEETMDQILILVNQGFTPDEIAPRLNLPAGEVALAVKLKQYLNRPLRERL